ncbi:hypothetical protein [Novosphingobium sp. Gsoil 351]|uniref:hypothetical protein n=1 Tax=Novosphingobium sp. Gsoil 351 TaxID=2675225 RepID=UPI0012B4DF30|nr:hypothetical protein [Novosphingobium sp. Gsoil 351]QGN55378.1 hypothetical protein GKE62_13315 [Novosphingobium sp. Gsoil 351]
MILRDRRRPALPAELVGRVCLIWIGVAMLQIAATTLAGRLSAVALPPVWSLPTVASALTLGCAMLLIGRIAYRLFDEEIAGLSCLASAVAVPLLVAMHPATLDTHGLHAVCILFALNGLMAREARLGGWAIGAALASALALSLDGAVLGLGFVAVAALKWLRNRNERWWLVHALHALTAVTGAIVAVKWAAGQAPVCGVLGIAHLAAFAWAAGVMTVVALFEPHPRAFTLGGMGAATGGALLLLGGLDSSCSVVAATGLNGATPLWRGGAIFAIQALGLPLLGFAAALRLLGPARDWLRRWWTDYALLMLLAAIMTALDARAAAAACSLAAVPIGWQMRAWTRAARNSRRSGRRALALTGVALALAPAMPLSLLVLAAPTYASNLIGR